RETQSFRMHLFMFLLLQQLQPLPRPPVKDAALRAASTKVRPPPFVEAARSAASFMDGCGEAVEAAEAAEAAKT
ncbi:MAG: hypothetical protein CMK83_26740, partial [Pseudomonadales bacterium]|nr:hypothetical protein [Pseudomonadales bacterium]